MYAHTIAQVEPPIVGVHLIWMGPRPWIYSPGGWFIQRRRFREQEERDCDGLNAGDINDLRIRYETRLRFGTVTLRQGAWSTPIVSLDNGAFTLAEVFSLELDESQSLVWVNLLARQSFVFALREGKVVAIGGDPVSGTTSYELRASAIETVVVYALEPRSLQFCIRQPHNEEEDWANVPFIVKDLQLPLQELMPSLTSPTDEFNEAAVRIPPDTSLDPAEFERLANTLRIGVQQAGPPRPIDQVLLMREDPGAVFEELIALDPLRVLVAHPKWRRALGFGWFDDDPSLVEGETYEYRLTGHFPIQDLTDTVYGFHTIPSQTVLPAEFYLHDLHLRLPQTVKVERAPDTSGTGLRQISRRGIHLLPQHQIFWQLAVSLPDWSLVVDFPTPVNSVILELHKDHALKFVWETLAGSLDGPEPVPLGPSPRLDFPEPVRQFRLIGEGFLFAIRIPQGLEGLQPVSVVLPPVTLKNTPRPAPPLLASIHNLQQAQPPTITDIPSANVPTRHALGFEVNWRPAPQEGISVWPSDETAAPPLDGSMYQIEHRQVFFVPDGNIVDSTTGWTPVLPEENWTLGSRDGGIRSIRIHPRVDLMRVYPEVPQCSADAGLDIFWRDVFDFEEGGNPIVRPVPPPGTFHQYRVRAVDAIGRPSPSWMETNILRLEKRVPPPVPVGPDLPSDQPFALPTPIGVQVRVLVQDAPDLTMDEKTFLGNDQNTIVLRWGWYQEQRDQDPFAREFRVYVADQPLDSVPGQLTNVTTQAPGVYDVTLNLDRSVTANAAQGSTLQAGYPFFIVSHSEGGVITVRLEARIPNIFGILPEPATGSIQLPLRLTPNLTRSPAWSKRFEIQPITAATTYETILRNHFTLTPEHPRDAIWVGVSSADDQTYVGDQLAPTETRPGNESAIVSVLCEARYHGRPDFNAAPSLDPVPTLLTPEPADRPILFELDLRPYLAGVGLVEGDRMRPERVAADAVVAAYYVSDTDAIMARVIEPLDSSEEDVEVTLPNPGDQAAVVAALKDVRTDALEDRFVVFLAGSHPYRDRLFEPTTQEPVAFDTFQETLPPKSGRYVYRVRQSDAAGHLSAGTAMASVVVRVPSLAPGAAPEKVVIRPGAAAGTLRLRIAPDSKLTHVLTFNQVVTNSANGGSPLGAASVLRVPNRPDLYPNDGIWLRAPDGVLLSPQAKSLSDTDVTLDTDGERQVDINFTADPGQRVRVWACTVTQDGIPSRLGGPWSLAMPLGPLPSPTLSATSTTLDTIVFTWTWSPDPAFEVALERSPDGINWQRISPLLDKTATTYEYKRPVVPADYRLRVFSLDGRIGRSNTVTI